jgi:hypothetical protein
VNVVMLGPVLDNNHAALCVRDDIHAVVQSPNCPRQRASLVAAAVILGVIGVALVRSWSVRDVIVF